MSRFAAAILAGAMVTAVAGCIPTTAPDPVANTSDLPATSPSSRRPTAPSPAEPDPNALTVEVLAVDRAETAGLLEFASDGESILFSSGKADGAKGHTAPDLYRQVPHADGAELVWANPDRNRTIVKIAGDLGTWAFVDMSYDGEPSWDLRVLALGESEPTRLATYAGGADLPALVPSFVVHDRQVIWTEFAPSDAGPISRLMGASAPDWTPVTIDQWLAADAEVWLPSLRGSLLAYTLVKPAPSSERHEVHLRDLADPETPPRRLDESGRATMPLLVDGAVIWKETEPGFSMFNWGSLVRHDLVSGRTAALPMGAQQHLNYPTVGSRFLAAWGADAYTFTVHDTEENRSRAIARYTVASNENVLRPHVSGDLIVWLHATIDGLNEGPPPELRYAFLPAAGSDRD